MSAKQVFPTRYYIRVIAYIFFSIFNFIFRIKKIMPNEVKNLKEPYLLLSNHVGFWDPFVIGHFLPNFTHFVSSDAAFKNKIDNFFLTSFGTIPKKKNIRDTKVIRDIISVIKQGESVGIFPEGVRTWGGSSFNIDKSIAKLIKLLKVPVIVATNKGMNLFNPRWSKKLRFTKIEVEYKILFSKEDISLLSEDEIYKLLKESLSHNEVEYQRKKMNRIYSNHKAENINYALYICPECNSINSFRVKNNNFCCNKCNYDINIDKYGFFKRINEGKLHFDNIQDWYNWEEQWLIKYVTNKIDTKFEGVIFEDENSTVLHSKLNNSFEKIGNANIKLYINKIELEFTDRDEILVFNYNDLQTINPQVNEKLEIFYNHEAYRIIGSREGVSALKWEVAVNVIWKKLGFENKLSAYISQ